MNDMTAIVAAPMGELAKALAAAQAEMKPAVKDSENPHFKSKYADLEAINEAARVLSKHGIAVLCVPNGWTDNRIIVRGMLIHTSGQSIEGVLEMPVAQPNNPQAVGSALSYSRRYLIASLANIAAGDDDGNAAADGAKATPAKATPRAEPEQAPPSAAVKFAAGLIASLNDAASYADASRILLDVGLIDVDGDVWALEAESKLARLKHAAPAEFARVQAAYEAKK